MKTFSKSKADYYINRLSLEEYESIRNKNIVRGILMYPVNLWKIPAALFYIPYKAIAALLTPSDDFDFNAVFGVIILLGCIGSFFASPYISIIAIAFFYTMDYCFKMRDKMMNDYRLAYNKKHGYSSYYDEYDIKFGKYDYDESYTYYYKDNGKTDYYSQNNAYGGNNNDYYGGYSHSGYQNQEASDERENNIFAGMSPEEAKEKYRELLKKYHPDNLETGDAEKAKDIIAQYEELFS